MDLMRSPEDGQLIEALLQKQSDDLVCRLEALLTRKLSQHWPAGNGALVSQSLWPPESTCSEEQGAGSEEQGVISMTASCIKMNPGCDLMGGNLQADEEQEVPSEMLTAVQGANCLAEQQDDALWMEANLPPTIPQMQRNVSSSSQSEPVNGLYGSGRPLKSILKQVLFETPAVIEDITPASKNTSKTRAPFQSGDSFHYEQAKQESQRVMQQKANKLEMTSLQSTGRVRCRRTVNSWCFEMLCALLIVSNSVFLGVQVEYYVQHGDEHEPLSFLIIQITYTSLFFIELVMRLVGEGCMFWRSSNWGWTLLDIAVVLLSLLEPILAMSHQDSSGVGSNPGSNLRILRILRVTRLVRVVRVVKVVRLIRALRTLVQSILYTLKSLLWAMLLLLIIMYIFSIILTDEVRQSRPDSSSIFFSDEAEEMLEKRFGNLHRSMNTLFRSVSGGLSWSESADALVSIHWIWGYTFSAYVAFCLFAVLNVMTGVFCHSAIKGAERDQEMAVQLVISERHQYLDTLEKLFQTMDDDKSGLITLDEFELHFQDEAIQAFFAALELETYDAWTLFRQLDMNDDHSLDAEEFLEGCLKLRGTARNIDMAAVKREGREVSRRVTNLLECLSRVEEKLELDTQSHLSPRSADKLRSAEGNCF